MEKQREHAEEKHLVYVDFLRKYGKLNEADRRILYPQLATLQQEWFDALLRYKRSISKEGRASHLNDL
jgi:hypothetical protein